MMKQWFTARELAELHLKGMPKTQQAYDYKAKKEKWSYRQRNGRGGGREYHISNLTDVVQMDLIEKLIGADRLDDLRGQPGPVLEAETTKKPSAEDRRNAKIVILGLFEKFRAGTGLGILAAETPFIKFYMAEAADPHSVVVPEWVSRIYPDFSVASLRNWRNQKNSADAVNGLSIKYGNRKGTGVLERANKGEVATYIAALITKQSHLKGGHVRDMVRMTFGDRLTFKNAKTGKDEQKPLPKIRTFERFISDWKAENGDIYMKLTNPDGYKNKFRTSSGKADSGIERLNQVWEIDASPSDVLCVDGRYSLYGLIDVFSRRVMFLVTKTPRTEASLLLIRRAIMEWGVPETIKTDNGSDFISHRFMTALMSLGINQDVCPPFSPEKKPFVERVIGTLQRDLMPILPGFVGHSVADRKKIEAVKAFSARLGEADDKAFAVQMTHEDLQGHIDSWCHKYAHKTHSSLGVSPAEKASSWVGSIKKIENERAMDLLLAPIASGKGYRKVTKEGIRVERGRFMAPELALYIGNDVFVRHDPSDMGRIYAFTDKQEFICEAVDVTRLDIDRQEIATKSKHAQKEFINEGTREIKRVARSIKPEDFINAYLKDQAEKSPDVIAFPRPQEIHTSKGLSEAERAVFQPKLPEKTTLNDRQQKAHEALIAELSTPKKAAPIVVDMDTREGRFRRAIAFEGRMDRGQRLDDKDFRWLQSYRNTPEYRSQKSMMEDFGQFFNNNEEIQ